jgi:hypothetical protein
MSIIEKLTEGIVNRDMAKEGQALLNKWSQTGLLEGLETEQAQHNMARLLENQAKSLLKESNTMAGGSVEGFAAVAFPIVRRVFAGLIANDLVSVQPMSLPSGLIFFLDFTFGTELGDVALGANANRLGNQSEKSIYGTNQVGSQVTGGVDIVGTGLKESLSGPRDMVGYAYGSPTGSCGSGISGTEITLVTKGSLTGSTETQKNKYLQWDPDILALSASGDTHAFAVFQIPKANITGSTSIGQADYDNLSAFSASFDAATGINAGDLVIRRLTHLDPDDNTKVNFVVFGDDSTDGDIANTAAVPAAADIAQIVFPITDGLKNAGPLGAIEGTPLWGLEDSTQIPEIDIKVDSVAITAQTKKLKAKWTPELGQDLNAYHNLDAEVELTSILSEQIALEIDREILADLVNGATAATYYWSRSPGLFVNRVNGNEMGAASAAPDFTGTVSEWYETLIETINDVSAQIHIKTLRGGANFIVCGPEVANILEFTSGFRANVTADADKGDIGAVKVGSLNRKFDIIVDPYFLRNVILVGRRGSSFLESGYVYAPYVPLQTTPTIFGPEDFVPRKGVMTRYAKKMVRPDLYGLVIVRDLLGGAGATS